MKSLDYVVEFVNMDQNKIKDTFEAVRKVVKVGRMLAKLTITTTVDDDALERFEAILDVIEPIAKEPAIWELIKLVLSLLSKDNNPAGRAAELTYLLEKAD
jgi:P2-related tail formation protein